MTSTRSHRGVSCALVFVTVLVITWLATAGPAARAQGTGNDATVYRDEHGVPHIEAETEEAAWYAMGHEQARDALLWIQANVKRQRGEASLYLSSAFPSEAAANQLNDLLVQVLDIHLGGLGETDLKAMFRVPNEPNPDQFYDNTVAYTAGLNDYRVALKNAVPGPGPVAQEMIAAQTWLISNGFQWVLDHDIEVEDILSWGRWGKAGLNWGVASTMDPTPDKSPVVSAESLWARADDIADETRVSLPFARLKAMLRSKTGGGSNGWSWTYPYQQEGGTMYTTSVADPHQLAQSVPFIYQGAPFSDNALLHVWFCHLKVTPPGAGEPSIDAFGYVQHGGSAMFLSHNAHVAYNGSAGPPNISDAFLLRLRLDDPDTPGGLPTIADPPQYYSYYADIDGDNGEDPSDWIAFQVQPYTVQLGGGQTFQTTMWKAGRFGVVAHPNPFWADGDAGWNLGAGSNAFYPDQGNDPSRIAVVTAYRLPMDNAVEGADHQNRLAVAMYKWMKAKSVYDVWQKIFDLDAGFMINFSAVDRDGRLLATVLGSVPRRGDDDALLARGYNGFPDKFDAYDKMDREPVPARYFEDRDFDWRFETPGDPSSPVKYLRVQQAGGQGNRDFHPFLIWDPVTPLLYPAPGEPPSLENPGFASVSNDLIWYAYTKDVTYQCKIKVCEQCPMPCATQGFGGNPFNILTSPETRLLDDILESGTMYHTQVWGPEANVRTRYTVQTLTEIANGYLGQEPQRPPLDIAGARSFAQDDHVFNEVDYQGPDGEGSTPFLQSLPVTVRILEELGDELGTVSPPPAEPDDLLDEYDREVRFFKDLWTTLFNPPAGWSAYPLAGTPVNLKEIWVDNVALAVFWYPDPADPNNFVIVPMPDTVGLIDFLWDESLIGNLDAATGMIEALSSAERQALDQHLDLLVKWDDDQTPAAEKYRMRLDSRAATLHTEYDASYAATALDFDRRWLPLWNGVLLSDDIRTGIGQEECLQNPQVVALDPGGVLPPLDPEGKLANGQFPVRHGRGWSEFKSVAFPLSSQASALGSRPATDPITAFEDAIPYDALYDTNGGVRQTLTPQHINDLVEFFLKLGGFYVDPAQNGGIPSTKKALYDLLPACSGTPSLRFFRHAYRKGYPITRNVARILVLRRLLDTAGQLEQWHTQIPEQQDVSRARILDPGGTQRFPAGGGDVACIGAGILRAVGTGPAVDTFTEQLTEAAKGVRQKTWCYGGSARILVTMFPKAFEGQTPEPPLSFFWALPGERPLHFGSPHFADLMSAYTTRSLLPTHFTDYTTNLSTAPEFPQNPYTLTYTP